MLLFIFRFELSILVKTQPNWGGVEKGEFGPGGVGWAGMVKTGEDQFILLTCTEINDMTSLYLNIALCQLGLLK